MSRILRRILSSPRARRGLLLALVIVILFVIFDVVIMPWYVGHGATLLVPPMVGLAFDKAVTVLEAAGLEPVKADTRPDPKAPEGTVVNQNPLPDAVVKEGRRVYLSVSGGEVFVLVPNLRGLSARDARFALERVGLKMGSVSYEPSNTFFQNTIMDQSVPAGSKLSRGSSIAITVSRGPIGGEVVTPDLTGKTLSEAEKVLVRHGLSVGRLTYQSGFDLVPNTIIDQFPRPGDKIARGDSVHLFVVKLTDIKEKTRIPEN